MSSRRAFRFGVVAAQAASGAAWGALARRVEELGFSTLLMPDTMGSALAPIPALAFAAAATERLRIGTYVLAGDWRSPAMVAKQAGTLHLLSGGRFELGLGAGRAGAADDYRKLELAFDAGGVRVERLAAALPQIKSHLERGEVLPRFAGPARPPILVAAGGPRALAVAAREADIVALASRPDEPEAAVGERVARLREAAADRFDELELNLNLGVVGDLVHPFLQARFGLDADQLARSGSPSVLRGSADRMAEELLRRREALGVSYYCVGDLFLDTVAPVVALLAGR